MMSGTGDEDPGAGDPGAGDLGAGDPGIGDPGAGDPGAGDPGMGGGDPGAGNPDGWWFPPPDGSSGGTGGTGGGAGTGSGGSNTGTGGSSGNNGNSASGSENYPLYDLDAERAAIETKRVTALNALRDSIVNDFLSASAARLAEQSIRKEQLDQTLAASTTAVDNAINTANANSSTRTTTNQ